MAVTQHKVKKSHPEYLKRAILTEHEVQDLLDEWSEENDKIINANFSSAGIKDKDKTLDELIATATVMFYAYAKIMESNVGRVSKIKAEQLLDESLPVLLSLGDRIGISNFKRNIESLEHSTSQRWRSIKTGKYKLDFDDRLRALEISTGKVLTNIINHAEKNKTQAKEVKQIVKDYINPDNDPAKPFDLVRASLGASKQYVPKDVVSGSVKSNLYSTTRNELSEIWRDMTTEAYQDADWVGGFDWVLSSSHSHHDMCDDLADNSPYMKFEPRPDSHPHCLCDWVANLRPMNELKRLLKEKGTLYNSSEKEDN